MGGWEHAGSGAGNLPSWGPAGSSVGAQRCLMTEKSKQVQKPEPFWAPVSVRHCVCHRAPGKPPTAGTRGPTHEQCPRTSREAGHWGTPGRRHLRGAPLPASGIVGCSHSHPTWFKASLPPPRFACEFSARASKGTPTLLSPKWTQCPRFIEYPARGAALGSSRGSHGGFRRGRPARAPRFGTEETGGRLLSGPPRPGVAAAPPRCY